MADERSARRSRHDEEAAHPFFEGAAPARRCPPAGRARDRPGHKGCSPRPVVNEFLLIKEVGFHPVGFVMGSSIYHLGIQTRRWSQSQELAKLTEAMYNARELAMTAWTPRPSSSEPTAWSACASTSTTTSGLGHGRVHRGGTAVKAEDGKSYRNNQASRSRRTSPAGFLDAAPDRPRPLGS